MAIVRLEEITRQFDRVPAIENISFEVPDGQFWVLVGPSGCGKSTILRTIAGLESATSGRIYIDNCLVNDIPARDRDVAMVFQNYALYPHMSVADNLAFGLKMRGADRQTQQRQVQAVARSLSLELLLDRKPKQLSGGQQQRVALGRAIAREPKVFLLDEPLSNLDAQLRDDTRAELKQLHQRLGITTIYVTHDQIEAMTLADRIVILDGGRIQQIGDPQTVYTQPANRMVATFIGNPPMNIFSATYHEGHFAIAGQTMPCPGVLRRAIAPSPGQTFDLGLRPEAIAIGSPQSSPPGDLATLTAIVELVEPLGRETLMRLTLPGSPTSFAAIAPGRVQSHPGDRLTVSFDGDRLFVFDRATGSTLYPA
ncbi:ABC transporter ATP-binding protein [Oxynema aestuarii]|jgi:multiple sugar transport system ATP-binding protein|uniref:ABC transporter ATP-binding protein n=1 Tax=Oxynema aestuarii AP17 TaxID=2064643 RepID=A0A6H1TX57_9CYAN|nr:ABC transporter ATP-binding protein [Oxynema aestuarii]QIZ70343.1 ABC transporter ATP-binding protein [Oxynema aestuarii AP17]